MTFDKLEEKIPSYYITKSKNFEPSISLNQFAPIVFDFAYGMSFGRAGAHRGHRTGGRDIRKNGEIFINTFQGKLAEFGLHEFFRMNGIVLPAPDVTQYGLGAWDDKDFEHNGFKISVKSAAHFSNLLLLETGDWTAEGCYIPDDQTADDAYDFFIFSRISPDGKKIMRENSWIYLNELDEGTLRSKILSQNWQYDIVGYIQREDLVHLITQRFILPQGALLNGKIPMDAENYYCQAGNMRSIENLLTILR